MQESARMVPVPGSDSPGARVVLYPLPMNGGRMSAVRTCHRAPTNPSTRHYGPGPSGALAWLGAALGAIVGGVILAIPTRWLPGPDDGR